MLDNLAIISRVLDEHHTIRGNVKLVGESVNDLEALFSLRKAYADWTQSSIDTLVEKQKKLQQIVSFLEEGLKNHFAFEEKALAPLFGELLMQALIFEHREIKGRLEEAKSVVADTQLVKLSREELLSKKSHIQQVISGICQMVEEHATKEEIILKMMKVALEEKRQTKG